MEMKVKKIDEILLFWKKEIKRKFVLKWKLGRFGKIILKWIEMKVKKENNFDFFYFGVLDFYLPFFDWFVLIFLPKSKICF